MRNVALGRDGRRRSGSGIELDRAYEQRLTIDTVDGYLKKRKKQKKRTSSLTDGRLS